MAYDETDVDVWQLAGLMVRKTSYYVQLKDVKSSKFPLHHIKFSRIQVLMLCVGGQTNLPNQSNSI